MLLLLAWIMIRACGVARPIGHDCGGAQRISSMKALSNRSVRDQSGERVVVSHREYRAHATVVRKRRRDKGSKKRGKRKRGKIVDKAGRDQQENSPSR